MKLVSKDDLASLIDIGRLLSMKEAKVEEKDTVGKIIKITVIVVGVLAVLGAAAYGVYRFLNRDLDDDFDDEFDDFDDDFYDDIDELDELDSEA